MEGCRAYFLLLLQGLNVGCDGLLLGFEFGQYDRLRLLHEPVQHTATTMNTVF